MAVARTWRQARTPTGPHVIQETDIPVLNGVFSDAFTDRYRRDGMAGVRVPHLNPAVWRFAIADAGAGAMLWRDDRGAVVAFNVAHQSGIEAWMGPLAVHPDHQRHGLGKAVVSAGIDFLKANGAKVIGLETMPRTMDNIGFYSSLGMLPGHLTLTVTIDGASAPPAGGPYRSIRLGSLTPDEADQAIAECAELSGNTLAGYDFSREIRLTEELALGDTLMLRKSDALVGFALCHSVPLVDGRVREELRVLKLVARDDEILDLLVTLLADHARRSGTRRVAIRVQGHYSAVYRRLILRGARVRWSDLRMTLDGYSEMRSDVGVVLSNWEI
ncbi:MAG TPA: GNAT family N-acetyltransferase [Gemmatimonadaceae bacterium]|nr:GNAT family N-acetyltransferase [Gemmatimonadaceae bacterium]